MVWDRFENVLSNPYLCLRFFVVFTLIALDLGFEIFCVVNWKYTSKKEL